MAYQAQSSGPFLKGLVASNQPLSQPKGSIPRGSNLLMLERGALTPCDGTGIINWFGGAVVANQGKFLAMALFLPTGVTPYYLALQVAKIPVGAPANLSSALVAGGTLTSGTTYYYVVTAIDGTGGETVASNETSKTPSAGNLSVRLTWNSVPNALGYNIYRGTSPGGETLLVASNLPVLQPSPLTATVSFLDNGISSFTTATFNNINATGYTSGGQAFIQFQLTSGTLPTGNLIGLPLTAANFTPSTFNGSYTIFSVLNSTTVVVKGGPGSGTGGTTAITAGPFTAGNGSNISAGAGTIAWSNTSGVTGVGSPAQVGIPAFSPDSQWLASKGFGFSIPGGATILGIEALITKSVSSHFADEISDAGVFLLKAGSIVGASRGNFNAWNGSVNTYGSKSDLWGTTWAPADINNANFGNVIGATSSSSDPGTAQPFVSLVQMTVFYSTGTPSSITIDNTSSTSMPPTMDSTSQTVLYQMPNGTVPVAYSNSNIVAYYPAAETSLGAPPSGGSGGGGTSGPGTLSNATKSTPSGGVVGLVGPLPQFKQFTNRMVIALGNGFPMQIFSDPTGTSVNPAFTGPITGVVVAGDQVTLTTSSTLTAKNLPVGSNVVLSNMSDSTYDGTFVVISVNTGAGTFVVRNTAASGGASTGTFTVSTTPILSTTNNFTPSYPVWAPTTAVAVGDVYVPLTQPGAANIYIVAIQAGVTGLAEPSWQAVAASGQAFPTGNIADGSGVIWQEAGYLASPVPHGAGHIEVYAGSLWAFNTYPTNTSDGLDGPTAIRMSNTNDPNGWNPVNQAFLDKDDGAEGMGMGKFTITAQGIPPEGSLIAFKYRVPYQLIGVFGANNFAIQPVSSDMGCLAPRTIQFVPGYGLMRYSHLGYSVFNGFRDEVISEQIRPYLFPVNDFDTRDITVADASYMPLSWSAQTADPPMFAVAIPIGNSGGKLTRLMCYDMILKCWTPTIDLPFAIGTMCQVQPVTSNPLTIFGGFSDGVLQRWQAGDTLWYTGGGASQQAVAWSVRTATMASSSTSQRLWARKLIIRGTNADVAGTISVQPRASGVPQTTVGYRIAASGDFDVFADIGLTSLRFDATISGSLHVELDGWDWAIEPRPFGVPVQAI